MYLDKNLREKMMISKFFCILRSNFTSGNDKVIVPILDINRGNLIINNMLDEN